MQIEKAINAHGDLTQNNIIDSKLANNGSLNALLKAL